MNEISKHYYNLCERIMESGETVNNTKELRNVTIRLDDITQNIVGIRDISPSYLLGEWLWYFSGRNSMKFISTFGSMWSKLSDDGKTNNSAYGYRMKYEFGFDQIEKVIELLKKDTFSRRAVINLNVPNENVITTKDEPCTIALQYLIRDGKLHCTAIMRSNDIWYGFPYDVAFFTELQIYIADRLGIKYGPYTHFVVSMHAYEKDFDKIRRVIYDTPKYIEFSYNRKKFHEKVEFISDLINLSCEHCGKTDTKERLMKFAEEMFDFKMEIEEE